MGEGGNDRERERSAGDTQLVGDQDCFFPEQRKPEWPLLLFQVNYVSLCVPPPTPHV